LLEEKKSYFAHISEKTCSMDRLEGSKKGERDPAPLKKKGEAKKSRKGAGGGINTPEGEKIKKKKKKKTGRWTSGRKFGGGTVSRVTEGEKKGARKKNSFTFPL